MKCVNGIECIKEECPLWNDNVFKCKLSGWIGVFLYQNMTKLEEGEFAMFLEEIRPESITSSSDKR